VQFIFKQSRATWLTKITNEGIKGSL